MSIFFQNLSPENAAILAALIAAVSAIAGSLLTQIFSNRQTVNRERQRYNIEVYQKFFAPILMDVFLYFDMRTAFRRGHDVNPNEEKAIYQRIFKHFEDNIREASPRFTFEYQAVKSSYITDQSGVYPQIAELELIHTFLDELHHVVRNYASFDDRGGTSQADAVDYYRFMYRFLVVSTNHHFDLVKGAQYTSLRWLFNKQILNNRIYRSLVYRLIGHYNHPFYRNRFLVSFDQLVTFMLVSRKDRGEFRAQSSFIHNRQTSDYEERSYLFPEDLEQYPDSVPAKLEERSPLVMFSVTSYSRPSWDAEMLDMVTVCVDISGADIIGTFAMGDLRYSVNGVPAIHRYVVGAFTVLQCENGKTYYVLTSGIKVFLG